MRDRLIPLSALVGCAGAAFMLVSCSQLRSQLPTKEDLADLQRAASGALHTLPRQIEDAVELTKQGIGDAQAAVDDAKARAEKVREGVGKLQEGKRLIKEGIGE